MNESKYIVLPFLYTWLLLIIVFLPTGVSYSQEQESLRDTCNGDQDCIDITCMRNLVKTQNQFRATNEQMAAFDAIKVLFEDFCKDASPSVRGVFERILKVESNKIEWPLVDAPIARPEPFIVEFQLRPAPPNPEPSPVKMRHAGYQLHPVDPFQLAAIRLTPSPPSPPPSPPFCKRNSGICIATATAAAAATALIIIDPPRQGLGTPPDFPTNQ